MYTFLRIRPTLEGLELFSFDEVGPIANDNLSHRFSSFDAGKASCFLERDRHHLLAVIESGFGSLLAFNCKIRSIAVGALSAPLSKQGLASLLARRTSATSRRVIEVALRYSQSKGRLVRGRVLS